MCVRMAYFVHYFLWTILNYHLFKLNSLCSYELLSFFKIHHKYPKFKKCAYTL